MKNFKQFSLFQQHPTIEIASTPFFNTVNLKGEEKKEAIQRMTKREREVLRFFRDNPSEEGFTPREVWEGMKTNLMQGSVRVAITNLCDVHGKLEKTENRGPGFGTISNHKWKLIPS